MRLILLAAAAAAAMLLPGMAARAQTLAEREPSFDCQDGRGTDRCTPEAQRRLLDVYGLEPIERHRAAGDFIHRIFFIDFRGEDRLALVYIRRRTREPEISVHFPRRAGADRVPAMTASVSERDWDLISLAASPVGRTLSPPIDPFPGVCHGSTVIVERTVGQPFLSEEAGLRVRRTVENSCTDGPAVLFADTAALMAVSVIPPCALIDPKGPPGAVGILRACALLAGDRYTAARIFNAAYDVDRSSAFADTFAGQETILAWPGEAPLTGAAAASFWRGQDEAAILSFEIEGVSGNSTWGGTVRGRLRRESTGAARRDEEAEVEQVWEEGAFGFRLARMTVGPFRPRR